MLPFPSPLQTGTAPRSSGPRADGDARRRAPAYGRAKLGRAPLEGGVPDRGPWGNEMARWLFKSEPSTWSWDQQVAAGAEGTFWNGVRNHLAKKQLMAMQVGEQGFFYHSNEGKAVVGIVEVIKEYYPDPTDPSGRFGMVDLKAVEALRTPVTLEDVKREPRLATMILINNSRLSVQPVTDEEYALIRKMGGLK